MGVVITLLSLEPAEAPTEGTWLQEVAKITPAPQAPGQDPMRCHPTSDDQATCATTWGEVMDRSYIQVTPASSTTPSATSPYEPDGHQDGAATAKQLLDHINWDRYLNLIQGRVAYAPIKFNGQAFNCNDTGKGWDSRGWGAGYWWQNTRQPYYNVLAQGDADTMRSFLNFYLRMLPAVRYRTAAQFKGTATVLTTAAALYEETCTQYGACVEKAGGRKEYASSSRFR